MTCPRQAARFAPISPKFSCILPFPQHMNNFIQYNVKLQSAKGVLHLSQRANGKSCLYACKCERRHSGTKKNEKSSISLFSVFVKSIYKQKTGFKTLPPFELECHSQLFICHLRMAVIGFFYFLTLRIFSQAYRKLSFLRREFCFDLPFCCCFGYSSRWMKW